ncbi:deaminase domain-containing protein [Lysinibacillus sphaericus]|uniref:deaminase domain-containing protein n=1 Tax=Lysinibacillus sphaericus TaxID=1421 RepID=UPI002FBE9077
MKTQIQSKVAEVKQQLRQMLQSQQHEFSLAGIDGRYIEDTGTVGRNTTTPSSKPSNTQPSQNSSNKKPDEAAKGTGQATVVRSTEQSLNRVDQIRQEFNVGSKRNIAFAEYEINGKKGELIGVSGNADRVGTVGVPDKRIFDTITTGNNPRTLDSEVKILEDLSSSLSKDASGKIYLFSELPFCISCAGVIKQFKQRFPNIDIIIDHGPGGK